MPLHLRNAVTPMMKGMGYGKGYRNAHNEPGHVARGERYLPEALGDAKYYQPGDQGREPDLVRRLHPPSGHPSRDADA